MRSPSLLLLASLCFACGDDDVAPNDTPDSGAPGDAGSLDARVDDGSLDARVSPDADAADAARREDAASDAGSCSLDQKYEFMITGGLLRYQDSFVLEAGYVTKTRDNFGGSAPRSCRALLGSCAALHDALKAQAVVSSFQDGERVLGQDSRPWDGSVLILKRADGKQITVGEDCPDSTPCTPIPEPVRELRDLLWKFAEEIDADPAQADGAGNCVAP